MSRAKNRNRPVVSLDDLLSNDGSEVGIAHLLKRPNEVIADAPQQEVPTLLAVELWWNETNCTGCGSHYSGPLHAESPLYTRSRYRNGTLEWQSLRGLAEPSGVPQELRIHNAPLSVCPVCISSLTTHARSLVNFHRVAQQPFSAPAAATDLDALIETDHPQQIPDDPLAHLTMADAATADNDLLEYLEAHQ